MNDNSNLQKPILYLRPAQVGRVTKRLCDRLQICLRGFNSLSALFLIFFLIIILSSGKTIANPLINEVMYDPDINDNYYEWIELFNPSNESINLSGWIIVDNSENESLEGDFNHGNGTTIIPPFGYAIITDHGTKFYENFSISNDTIKLYVDDSSIGNSLGNSGDKLILKNETGEIIDAVEWIIDYEDVEGTPASSVLENHSLSRYTNVDTNSSSNDFYETSTSTPGAENLIELKPSFEINQYPEYVPKVENDSLHSRPFAIKINISNYPANVTYQIKSYIIGNISSSLPATQTWNGTSWEYSTYYTSTLTTDSNGNYSGWQILRFKKDYREYEENIKDNFSAYLHIKIKNDNTTNELIKTLYLLDMDESTSNGTLGGFTTGLLIENNTYLERKAVVVENEFGKVTGIYLTEDNEIDEGLGSIPGYFKVTSPVGYNYTIKFLDNLDNIIKTIKNFTIRQGSYKVDIDSNENHYQLKRNETLKIPLVVKNIGNFSDTIDIKITQVTDGWFATLGTENINLNSKEIANVFLHITPCESDCIESNVTIKACSENDVGEFDEIKISFKILGPDLTINDVKIYNEEENETNLFGEGEIVKIKAAIKNLGNENATNVNVTFYYDYLDEMHFIEYKNYDSLGDNMKYPTVVWDTKDIQPGTHTIYVIVDEENKIDEMCETNNKITVDIKIFKTNLSKTEKEVLIVEIFYNTHPKINNEFITLYNPTNESIDLSGWSITKNPLKTKTEQTKIIFPNLTKIDSKSYLYITENASAYSWEIGKKPNFEYNIDSRCDVPQMLFKKNFTLGNTGEVVVLKDCYNHSIDIVVYGKIEFNESGWVGPPIPSCRNGILLKRNTDENGTYIDTNCSNDWLNQRKYGIGQSNFPNVKILFFGEIKTFVSPDCSFKIIVDELRNASHSIYLNIYEFTNPILCDELINALLRNVSVNILLEGSPVGGITDEEKFILKKIANYGGNIRFIINDVEKNIYKRYIFNHGKYLIIDNKTVIVESCNWAKSGIPKNPSYGNREWGIVVKNESIANFFFNVFLDDWEIERCDIYSFKEMDFIIPDDFYFDENFYKGSYEPRFESKNFIGNFSCIPVFSPDNSIKAICDMIDSANESIYIQQLYIYKDWDEKINPFVELLINKSKQGVDIKVILNYNPCYDETNEKCNQTKSLFDEIGIQTKFIYSNWSIFSNVHNKGMIVDNKSVLISSINWNENSVLNNREAGIIIINEELTKYYSDVFFYDWNLSPPKQKTQEEIILSKDYKNTIYIVVIFTVTFALIVRDWRKRQWT
jgi:cardiolipin synthase